MIAFFGMGLLGSNFVRALERRGETVRVWNRSSDKARALASPSVTPFDDPAEAVRGATRLHLTLSDDAAVDEVLDRARPGFGRGLVIVDHTTTSATGTAVRAARWAERGAEFQHAPVFMGPVNALESTGLMLASGDRARFDALEPELAKMTGKLWYLGDAPERAAAMKLLGNSFLIAMTAGLADTFALAKALGVSPADAGSLFDVFNPATLLPARAKRMVNQEFDDPSWELVMARKDARLMIEEAGRAGVPLAVLPAVAQEMDRWLDRGFAHSDWTVIVRDALTR